MRPAALVLAAACLLPLPVAALKRNDHALYNSVVDRHRSLFSQAERFLRAHQDERHDRRGTEMANQDSWRANGLDDGICEDAQPLAEAALAAPPEGLPTFARTYRVSWPRL